MANDLVRPAATNLRYFIERATFKCRVDQEAALNCLEVLESEISGLGDLVAVLRAALAAEALARHQAEIARLREALEPFARVVVPDTLRRRDITIGDERIVSIEMPFAPHERVIGTNGEKPMALCLSLDGVTVGDFRRARTALAQKETPDE